MDSSSSDSRSKIETRQFTFAELPDYSEISHFKPEGFKTPVNSFEISSWREAYRIFCRYLLKEKPRHIRAFKNLEETFLGRRVMFSNDPFLLNEAYQLRSGFYAEIFLPPKSIIHNISRLIQFCRLSPRQFVVTIPVYVDESELSEPEEVEDEQNKVESQLAKPEQPEEEVSEDETIQESVSTQPSSQIAHFTLDDDIPDLAFSKPVSITINTNRYSVSKWRDIVSETARYVYENDAESFLRYLYKNFGPKGNSRPLFSDKSSNLLQASRIDSNLYVETNFSSVDCVKKALLFIRYANIPQSKVQIEYLPAGAVNSNNLIPAESANINTEPEEELEDSAVVESNTSEQSQTEPASIESKEDNDIPRTDDNKPEEFKDDKKWDFSNDEDDFVDIGMEFTDDGLPVLTPGHQMLIDAIEEKFPKGIDIDNEDSVRALELASGIPCNKYTIEDLRMILAYNKADNVFYVPLRLADESTVKSMAAYIDQNVDQYNAVSLSVIREKFQDQFDCECDDEELLEFIEWYVFREMDRVVAIDYNDIIGDGVCLPRSITTDEFCENFYGQIESYLEKTDRPVPMSQLRQLYPSLNETIISYALSDDRFGSIIQEETKDEQLFYSIRPDSQLNDDAEDELESEPECETLSFTLDAPIPDLKFSKPVAMTIGDNRIELTLWREAITKTAEYLSENEPISFNSLIEEYGIKSKNRPLFSRNRSDILQPYPIGSELWVETKFDATDCVRKAKVFLGYCYIKLTRVRVEYIPGSANGSIRAQNIKTENIDNAKESGSRQSYSNDYSTFTKPLNLSMFFTCVVIPTQCHKAFLDNLTVDLKEGMSELVTLWFNDEKYKVVINNLFFSSADSSPQIRFTWNPNLPIAIALRKACPESFQILERNSYSKSGEDKQEVSDTITISCGTKPNEFVLQVNSQKESEKLPEPNSEQTDSEKEPLNVESDQEKTVQPDETSQQQDKFGEIYCKYQPETSSEQTEGESDSNPEVSEALSQPENEKQESVSQSDELQQSKEDSNTEESGIQESASSSSAPSGLSCFKLNGSIPNLTYCKPVSISIDNQKRSVSTWRQILTVIVNYLCQHELLSFRYLTKQQRVSKQNRSGLFSNTPLDFIQPYEVESGLWIETNFSPNDCIKKAVLCLNECLVDKSRFEVEYAPQDYVAVYRPENAENIGKDSAPDTIASQSKAEDDYTSFTKPVNKSMFNMCIVIPMQCHKAFFSHLSNVPKVGESVPVTLWLNNLSYSVTMHNLSFPVCNASPQVRFTWTPSSSIAHALIEECPESYRLFQSGARISRQDAPDTITVSCGNKLDEFILQVNSQKTSGVIQEENQLQEENSSISDPNQILSESDMISEQLIDEFGFTPEERNELVKQIEELIPEVFPNGSCREAQLQLLLDRLERLTTIDSLERFLIQNNIAILSRGWLYFLTDKVQAGLFEVLRQMEQEGQILADYNLLYEKKLDLFDSINVYKNEEVISKLFIALMAKNGAQAEIRCYPTERWLALKENATIKDALIDCFSRHTVLSYYQLNNELPYIPIEECRYVISHEPDFIRVANNVYTIRDRIFFDDQLREKLNALVQSEVEKNMYISCARLDLSEAMEFNPEISQSALLDYYCQELMPKRYKRKGNVISDAENPTDSSTIISSYCQSNSSVTLDELKDLARDLVASEQTAYSIAFDKLVRVDKDHFINPESIHFDVDEIDRVIDSYISGDYIPIQDVYSFSSFPISDSQRPWNWFLLESFCRKYSKQFDIMAAYDNNQNVGVIVRKTAKYDNYYTLMATAVLKSDIELTSEAVSRFLFQGHYIAVSNPTLIQRVLEKARILNDSSEV